MAYIKHKITEPIKDVVVNTDLLCSLRDTLFIKVSLPFKQKLVFKSSVKKHIYIDIQYSQNIYIDDVYDEVTINLCCDGCLFFISNSPRVTIICSSKEIDTVKTDSALVVQGLSTRINYLEVTPKYISDRIYICVDHIHTLLNNSSRLVEVGPNTKVQATNSFDINAKKYLLKYGPIYFSDSGSLPPELKSDILEAATYVL